MPATAHPMAATTRGGMRSCRKSRDSTATAAGMAAITTPAATAELSITPYSMQIEKRKLPRKLSQKSRYRSCCDSGVSPAWRGSQLNIATAPMPKRSHASRNTGNTASSSFDKPT